MASVSSKKFKWFDVAVLASLLYLMYHLVFRVFFPVQEGLVVAGGIRLSMLDASLRNGDNPVVVIENKTELPFQLESRCPRPPLDLFFVEPPGTSVPIAAEDPSCSAVAPIAPGDKAQVSLMPWKYSAFSRFGTYEVRLPGETGTGALQSGTAVRFDLSEPGVMVKLFRALITKPFLNFLIFVASVLPGHNLAIGIIILTLLVKLLLFLPTQHALEGQKKMQLLQPKLEAVRKQFADDPQKMQAETMKLWKDHGVNPLQSCLPILVQFPVLIGLFYVVRDGIDLSHSRHLIYPVYQDLDWTFNTHFFGLDLTLPYIYIFPPLLVALQFIQMKLTFMIADKKKAKQIEKTTTPQADTPQEIQQRVMLYVLPLMIGFFAIKFPSAVSLYWGISTLFAIGQQMIVNREHIKA